MSTAIRAESTGGGQQVAFWVSLIFLIKDQALLDRIGPDEGGFGEGGPIVGHGEVFRFRIETVADEEDLSRRLAVIRTQDRPGQFLLISDLLTVRRPKDG